MLTINTMKGFYIVRKLPFAISAAPEILQGPTATTLAGTPDVIVYLDDIIVSGATSREHPARLEEVLRRLDTTGVQVCKEKCCFALDKVLFPGHKIDVTGMHPTQDEVKSIMNAPELTDKVTLQVFLGLLAFHDRFLKDRATARVCMYKLLEQSTPWRWDNQHKEASRSSENRQRYSSPCTLRREQAIDLILKCVFPWGWHHTSTDRFRGPGGAFCICFMASRTCREILL